MLKNRVLPTVIVALVGAIIGSFVMMLYASTHFAGVAGPNHTPPAVSAAPLAAVSDQQLIVDAVKRTLPSVVAIDVTISGVRQVPVDPFGQFYQNVPYKEPASGSGFVISSKGLIVTNAHVVTGPNGKPDSKVVVVFKNGDRIKGTVYAVNPAVDVALVKVNNYPKLPPPLQLGDSSKLQLGQWAIAIGEPLELQNTVTVGVVSGFNRTEVAGGQDTTARRFTGLLQTSAPINPGNSGGPLIDMNGNVIGINQLTATQAQNIGFAIPIDLVKQVVASLEHHPGEYNGPNVTYLGVYYQSIDNNLRRQLNYLGDGVVIAAVAQGSPAAKAKLQAGDVIQAVDGARITSSSQFQKIIKSHKPGDTLHLRVWSQGEVKQIAVALGSIASGNLNIVPGNTP
jgi:S1-C subfamily serine protease